MMANDDLCEKFLDYIQNNLGYESEELSGYTIITLPFRDSFGDRFTVRLKQENGYVVLDDGGITDNTVFTIRETVGDKRAQQIVNSLLRGFGAVRNPEEGVVEYKIRHEQAEEHILHFAKLLFTLDTMLVQLLSEEKEKQREKPQRLSLGPRASQKLRKSLSPLIRERKVDYRQYVDGRTIPDWLVDFTYKPSLRPLSETCELVAVITVDLAVEDPIQKSSYAYTRAVDIKAQHANYEIRVAYDTHGQNTTSSLAANFLKEYALYSQSYEAVDMSPVADFNTLLDQISRELELRLRY
jgi:hypothetical protein